MRTLHATFALILVIGASCTLGEDYLDETLRVEVDQLITEVQATPTSLANARQRADVLWRWTNQWALDGRFVPVNLTTVVNGILGVDTPSRNAQHRRLDDYIHQLAFIDADPKRLGTLEAQGGPFTVTSYGTLKQTFTVGTADVATGGAFLVGRHFMGGYRVQATDPSAANFVSISSSNQRIEWEIDSVPLSGMHGGFRGATGALAFRISSGTLTQGDTVTITYGDTTAGGPGIQLSDIATDFMVFPLYVAFNAEDLFIALPLQPITIRGGPVAGVHAFAPSIVKTNEPFEISVRSRDPFYNRPTEPSPSWVVMLNDEVVAETEPSNDAISEAGASGWTNTTRRLHADCRIEERGHSRLRQRDSRGDRSNAVYLLGRYPWPFRFC